MERCIQLAKGGLGRVSPNPMVGCVIVQGDTIIAEGYHLAPGGAHAEAHAIESVKDKSVLKHCRMYVSLEPCCHEGKTPPCTTLITRYEIPEVIVGMKDPFERVRGRGMAMLKKAGVKVRYPVLEKECRNLNRRFITFHEKKRPYVILKWAESRDGFIAPARPAASKRWISNSLSRTLVHRWRSEEDAIMVGTKTARVDNPRLDVRMVRGRNPVRVVTDRNGKLPPALHILDGKTRTIVFTEKNKKSRHNLEFIRTDFGNFPDAMLRQLHEAGVQSLIVEGGAALLASYLESGRWDEIRRFTGTTLLQDGLRAPRVAGSIYRSDTVGTDTLDIFYR